RPQRATRVASGRENDRWLFAVGAGMHADPTGSGRNLQRVWRLGGADPTGSGRNLQRVGLIGLPALQVSA
ncbi:MAG TPA: hypothetical protein VHO24_21080, partial [Opitutaceae bacterium]|nr:hypothetical protein [Opitutaceae bacterium]